MSYGYWISVTDGIPDDEATVLLAIPGRDFPVTGCYLPWALCWYEYAEDVRYSLVCTPSHWCPIPDMPK